MQYKVTKQYIKDVESPLAEFIDMHDADMFISNKPDTYKASLLIYRLYNNAMLVSEYNKDKYKSPISLAQYANGDIDLPEHFAEPYRVTYRSKDNKEHILATFRDLEDARFFVDLKFRSNRHSSENDPRYMIYDITRLLEIIDQKSIVAKNASESKKQGKRLTFRPTPTLKLTRGPKSYLTEVDDDEDEEKTDN